LLQKGTGRRKGIGKKSHSEKKKAKAFLKSQEEKTNSRIKLREYLGR